MKTKSDSPDVAKRVPVIMLVDELTNVGNETSALLQELASTQQCELAHDRIFIPIVTSFSVDAFASLSTKSARPVFVVPLLPA